MRPWIVLLVLAACSGGDKDDSEPTTSPTGSTTSATATGGPGTGATATGTGTGATATTGTGTGATGPGTGGTGPGTGGTGPGTGGTGPGTGGTATTGTGTGTGGTGTGTPITFPCGPMDCVQGETCYEVVPQTGTPYYNCYAAGPNCPGGISDCNCIICDQPGAATGVCSEIPGVGATCTQYP